MADSSGLVFGVAAAVITARWLGTSGKGLFSSLAFLAALVMQLCSIGLGDAAIVLVGQKKATLQQAVSATVAAGLISSVFGVAILALAAAVAFDNDWAAVRPAVLLAAIGSPVALGAYLLTFLLNAQERIVAGSVVLAATSAMSTLGLFVFLVAVPLGLPGAVLAGVVGSGAGLALGVWLVARVGVSLRPRWDRHYLAHALRYGFSVELSYLVTVMFLRVDLLLVYGLAGSDSAGQYSVALTIGALVGLLPIAISNATFPRLAHLDEDEAQALTVQAFRFGISLACAATLFLAGAVPIAIPLVFGKAFSSAVLPALILLPGGVLWSGQWLLCRAWAARGRPGLLLGTFSLSLVVMVALDYALIPPMGINGAALSALAAPTVGLLLCLHSYQRSPLWQLPLRRFVPLPGDFRSLTTQSLALLPWTKSSSAAR